MCGTQGSSCYFTHDERETQLGNTCYTADQGFQDLKEQCVWRVQIVTVVVAVGTSTAFSSFNTGIIYGGESGRGEGVSECG